MSTFVCACLFTHTGAINSHSYQHCGHSKTQKYTINTEGRPAYWLFSHTPKKAGGRGGMAGGHEWMREGNLCFTLGTFFLQSRLHANISSCSEKRLKWCKYTINCRGLSILSMSQIPVLILFGIWCLNAARETWLLICPNIIFTSIPVSD